MTHSVSLQQKEFTRLSRFIQSEFGIKMPEIKKTLLESRLQKRLRNLRLSSFKEYCDYLFSDEGLNQELPYFIDKVTTNKTDFFRENEHFEWMEKNALPAIIRSKKMVHERINIWSAGCSSGEEPYTLAMVVSNFLENNGLNNLQVSILATDVSLEVLNAAQKAVYDETKAAPIPLNMKKKYLLKSKKEGTKIVKIAPEIRKLVQFGRLNFMDQNYGIKEKMDIVFCRNVIIYFDKVTQEKILNRIVNQLLPGGYFFQGHSETTQGINLPLKQVFPTIYIRT